MDPIKSVKLKSNLHIRVFLKLLSFSLNLYLFSTIVLRFFLFFYTHKILFFFLKNLYFSPFTSLCDSLSLSDVAVPLFTVPPAVREGIPGVRDDRGWSRAAE